MAPLASLSPFTFGHQRFMQGKKMIEVLNYYEETKSDGRKTFYVDIKLINGLIIRKIAHLTNDKGRCYNRPTFTRVFSDGIKKYIPFIEFELSEHNAQFFEKLSEAVKEFKKRNHIPEPQPLELTEEVPF
jgi:hypothetical protein